MCFCYWRKSKIGLHTRNKLNWTKNEIKKKKREIKMQAQWQKWKISCSHKKKIYARNVKRRLIVVVVSECKKWEANKNDGEKLIE